MGTVWAPPEEGTQGINISALTWMCLICCRLHPSECTKLLMSSTASGCRFPRCGERAGGDALCTVHLGMMFRSFHTTFLSFIEWVLMYVFVRSCVA